jgi:hypothetical protein
MYREMSWQAAAAGLARRDEILCADMRLHSWSVAGTARCGIIKFLQRMAPATAVVFPCMT